MSMTIPTEAQNLLDAALEAVICRRKSATGYDTDKADKALSVAADAYRATQVKECRPPDGAKRGDLFWLVRRDGMKVPAGWMENDAGFYWDTIGHGSIIPSLAGVTGWTVHSEVKFGEPAGVVATDEAVDAFLNQHGIHVTGREYIRLVARHFRAPKLEISDEELRKIMEDLVNVHNYNYCTFARAVIAKVGGEK